MIRTQRTFPADTTGADLRLSGLCKTFATSTALHDINVTLPQGQFSVLLGPSGCGKSTLLRLIAGLENPTSGKIHLGDARIDQLPPKARNLSMVFQSYALFPHLDVAENILFGLSVRGTPKADRAARLHKVAAMMGLSDLLARKPAALSGGQQQRVALARAVISERPVCLMDEPLSNLDAKLRAEMRVEIRALQQRLGLTMVYVTHDQVEAMTMADRIVVMHAGRIEQVASPRDLYAQPATMFVAGFIGTPPMNLIPRNALPGLDAPANATTIGIRPEDVTPLESGAGPQVTARVMAVEYLGADQLVTLAIEGATLLLRLTGRAGALPATLDLRLPQLALHFFDAAGHRLPSPSDLSHPQAQEHDNDQYA
ncbi:MAG: ABC transporter ATP-binding protein [Loktanella sp.]|nr:ABC transporter ATP-binding protein [Loktanella sp.]